MQYIQRVIEPLIQQTLARGKSILLLGARQTGKTTLLKHLDGADLSYTLLDPEIRLRFEKSPNLLRQEILAHKRLAPLKKLPLVIIDEIQKVPVLMDVIQLLIDNDEAIFIITGSSVRKLRRHPQFNLLPGRVVNLHLDPLSLGEIATTTNLESLLVYGSLPRIYLENNSAVKQTDLEAYVVNYLEEEIRSEALVRELGSFARFLELAAIEAGNQININKLSQELGINRHTITEYFNVLEDCLVAERIMPITDTKTRKRLTKTPKYLLFDMGIRRIAAREGSQLSSKTLGQLFEQFIGLELLRFLRNKMIPDATLRYWRDHDGPEIDYVLEIAKKYLPIEVKWTETPTLQDAKHLIKFMQEYDCIKPVYIICRCKNPLLLHDDIIALPWQKLSEQLATRVHE